MLFSLNQSKTAILSFHIFYTNVSTHYDIMSNRQLRIHKYSVQILQFMYFKKQKVETFVYYTVYNALEFTWSFGSKCSLCDVSILGNVLIFCHHFIAPSSCSKLTQLLYALYFSLPCNTNNNRCTSLPGNFHCLQGIIAPHFSIGIY